LGRSLKVVPVRIRDIPLFLVLLLHMTYHLQSLWEHVLSWEVAPLAQAWGLIMMSPPTHPVGSFLRDDPLSSSKSA
jgi:hypothetical protein